MVEGKKNLPGEAESVSYPIDVEVRLSSLGLYEELEKTKNCREKDTDNEKYAFRCFLLRLGFIGAEYKQDRKILLRNLTGSSAFKSGGRQA